MGILNFVKGVVAKINKLKPVIVVKAQIQTAIESKKKDTINTVAGRVGSELITPTISSTGLPETVVPSGREGYRGFSTPHVREAGFSAIYFNDVLKFELEDQLRTQYITAHAADYVMVPMADLRAVLSQMSDQEIEDLKGAGYLVVQNNQPTMTVAKYREWQQKRTVQVRQVKPIGLTEGITAIKSMKTASAETCRGFYLDYADTLGIAESYGGGTTGVLNEYAQQADIPVPILAVCAIMSVRDKNGLAVPLVNETGQITKETYLAVRQALDGDPLVGFLDAFTGYSVDANGKVNSKQKTTFGNTGIPLAHLHGGLHQIIEAATTGFLIHADGYATNYAFRASATRIDSQCEGWITTALTEFKAHRETVDRALLDIDQLNADAAEFASETMDDNPQVRFIDRRQKNLLRTVMGNQTAAFKDTIVPNVIAKYEEIFETLTGDFQGQLGVVGESSHKFVAPKPFDAKAYTADYAMLQNNVLLINSIELRVSERLQGLDLVDLSTPEKAEKYLADRYGLTAEQISSLAGKYGEAIDVPGEAPRAKVERMIVLQARDHVTQLIKFNQSVFNLVALKEDLRICEYAMGQYKFANLTKVEDMHTKALEHIRAQQAAIIEQHKKPIKDAQEEITRLKGEKSKAQQKVKDLTTEIDGLVRKQKPLAEAIIGDKKGPFYTILTSTIEGINKRNGKGFVVTSPAFTKLLDSHMSRILRDDEIRDAADRKKVIYKSIYNSDGSINEEALTFVVGNAVTEILTANRLRAEGIVPQKGKTPTVSVDSALVADITTGIVSSIMTACKTGQFAANASTIQGLIAERTTVQNTIDGNEAEGIVSFDNQIAAQEDIISEHQGIIDGITDTPEEKRQIINAEKQYYAQLATVKSAEFAHVVSTLTAMVTKHNGNLAEFVENGFFTVENGQLVIPENSPIRAIIGEDAEVLASFETQLKTYGAGTARLMKTLGDRITEIQNAAFKNFDLVINIENGQIVGEPRHIDNPTRVAGDIDSRIVDLYEHQTKIDRYNAIMDPATTPETRLQLLDLIPDAERAALGIGADGVLPADVSQMNTFLSGRIQAELEASDQTRLAYASMSDAEKIKFQRDYVRYMHYVEGQKDPSRFIDAERTRKPLNPTSSTEIVDDLGAIDTLFAEGTEYAVEAAAAGEKFEQVSVKQMRKPKVRGASETVDESTTSPAPTTTAPRERVYSEDAIKFQEAFDTRSLIAYLQTEGMTDETRLATIQAYAEKYPDRAEFYSSLVTPEGAMSEEIATITETQESIMTEIAATKGELTDPKCATFVQEVVSKHFAELQAQGIEYTDADVQQYMEEVQDVVAMQQEQEESKKKGKTPKKPTYTAKGCQNALKALSKDIAKLEEKIKARKMAATEASFAASEAEAAAAAKQEKYERALLEKGFLDMVAVSTKPILSTLTAPQIVAIVDKTKVTIEGTTLETWRDLARNDEDLFTFVADELGMTSSEVEVVSARQLQTISDPSVVVNENGQIVNASGVQVAGALYDRIDNASPEGELTTLEGRDAVLYAALRGIADRDTVQAQVEEMYQLFKTNGIPITQENIAKFVSGELEITTPATETTPETTVKANTGVCRFITGGLQAKGLVAAAEAGDTGMGS